MTRTNDCYRQKDGEWVRCTWQWAQREEPLWIEFSCDAQHLWTAYVMGRGGFIPKTFVTLEGQRSLSLAKQAAIEFANTHCKK
jgi:hypothetical protein